MLAVIIPILGISEYKIKKLEILPEEKQAKQMCIIVATYYQGNKKVFCAYPGSPMNVQIYELVGEKAKELNKALKTNEDIIAKIKGKCTMKEHYLQSDKSGNFDFSTNVSIYEFKVEEIIWVRQFLEYLKLYNKMVKNKLSPEECKKIAIEKIYDFPPPYSSYTKISTWEIIEIKNEYVKYHHMYELSTMTKPPLIYKNIIIVSADGKSQELTPEVFGEILTIEELLQENEVVKYDSKSAIYFTKLCAELTLDRSNRANAVILNSINDIPEYGVTGEKLPPMDEKRISPPKCIEDENGLHVTIFVYEDGNGVVKEYSGKFGKDRKIEFKIKILGKNIGRVRHMR
jgi:hypothetical protein